MNSKQIEKGILALEDKQRAVFVARFFQTGKGQYGEGDRFLGIYVPVLRKIIKKYQKDVDLNTALELLQNKYNEIRFVALCLMICIYKNSKILDKKKIVREYLKNISKNINNWNLVDASCEYIIGSYCFENNDFSIMEKLVKSKNLWERRVAIVSTFYAIKNGNDEILYQLLPYVINDRHHLIWKAGGWMLREAGKRVNRGKLVNYLMENYDAMPSVMRSYACEHLNRVEKLKIIHRPL